MKKLKNELLHSSLFEKRIHKIKNLKRFTHGIKNTHSLAAEVLEKYEYYISISLKKL